MKFKCVLLLACLAMVSACGDLYHIPGDASKPDNDEIDLDISDNTDFSGNYDIVLMEFDSDVDEKYITNVTVTTVMRNISGSTNGKGWVVQAAIGDAYLDLGEDGSYELYYKFTNASKQPVKIGTFSGGSQSGTYSVFGTTILFSPDDNEPGFADSEVSTYTGEFTEGHLIISAELPSLDGSYLKQVKAVK